MSFMFIFYNEFYRIILYIIITAIYVYYILLLSLLLSLLLKLYVLVYHKTFMCMNINNILILYHQYAEKPRFWIFQPQ